MLIELTVRNFAVIEQTRLELAGPGLNVVTGETGAGKSLLVDALEFVLGGAADRSLIRAGADRASVEAVFQAGATERVSDALANQGVELDEDGTLVLFRETHKEGRTVSRVNGHTTPVNVVREIGRGLVDIHGQGTHLSLLDPSYQLVLLDAFAGTTGQRADVAAAVAARRSVERELSELASDDRAAEQQRDLLQFQVSEIAGAELRVGEEETLLRERETLANAQMIQEACSSAYDTLYADQANATDLVALAVQALRKSIDPSGELAKHVDALEASAAQLVEAARDIRSYAESIEGDPQRLQEIEDRLETIKRLKRKYGADETEVLRFAEEAQRKLDAFDSTDERRAELGAALERARQHAGALAWALSHSRRAAAESLEAAVAQELDELGMGRVSFTVSIAQQADVRGLPCPDDVRYAFDATGIDRIEFMVQTNPGEDVKPLSRVASGGEASRLMLALVSALRTASHVPTLVFDEIDAGIGARASEVVGRKLWALGGNAQVLCVTHLPQIAAYADRHFRVRKDVSGDRTFAGAEALDSSQRLEELSEMLGGRRSNELDGAARQMLEAADAVKAAR